MWISRVGSELSQVRSNPALTCGDSSLNKDDPNVH